MDYGLDTSALLRIVTSDPPNLAVKVARAIQLIVEDGGTLHVSDSVVQEAYYALQHHYGATKENAVADLLALRSTSRLPNFSALFRDFRGAGANRRLSRLPNLLADLAGFGRGGDSSAFPSYMETFEPSAALADLQGSRSHCRTCKPVFDRHRPQPYQPQ